LANYFADFLANYLAKIGELFGNANMNFRLCPTAGLGELLQRYSHLVGVIIGPVTVLNPTSDGANRSKSRSGAEKNKISAA